MPVQEIIDSGYNLDRKNPHSTDEGPGDADELLSQFQTLQQQIDQTRDKLKQELMSALGGDA